MKLFLMKADNSKDMEKISEELSQHKFKTVDTQDNFILMRKRRYGNILIHVVCLIIALQFIGLVIFINVAYFAYSFLWASPNVFITTETEGDDGETLEFSDMDEILKELMFKYTNMYFLNIQLPYESDRTIRFGIALDDSGISQSNASADYVEGGKLYQSILNLKCEGCVLVSYTPTKLRRTTHDVVAIPPK